MRNISHGSCNSTAFRRLWSGTASLCRIPGTLFEESTRRAGDERSKESCRIAMGDRRSPISKRRKVQVDAVSGSAVVNIGSQQYADQLAQKVSTLRQLFKDLNPPELEIFESVKEHYRQRAEFKVWQSKDDIYYVMFEKATGGGKNQPWEKRRVDSFPVASQVINELMASLLANIKDQRILRQKLFQANFHSTLAGESMVTLVYHRQLDDSWREAAEKLREALNSAVSAARCPVSLIGRSKNQKLVLGEDFVVERMQVDQRSFVYKQVEGGFSQPNGVMCAKMLGWARDVTRGSTQGDLLELYCGNGNFTIALAENFREVIATEFTKASVAAAKFNVEANGTSNVHIARLSSEEFVQAWRGDREFVRMKNLPAVKDRKFKTLLVYGALLDCLLPVDPPRAGLDDKTVELLQHFDNIVYVSCNPATLHANLLRVAESHAVKRIALFDQFPYTEHIECGVYLTRKSLLS